MKPTRTWILIADSSRARIVRSAGAKAEPLEDIVFEADHKQLKEIMADKPGRSFASVGTNRSAMEYHSDPVRRQSEEFAALLVEELGQRSAGGEFDRLAVVAEPRMLGLIRRALPQQLADKVVAEIDKDLTKLPALELRDAIAGLGIPGLVP